MVYWYCTRLQVLEIKFEEKTLYLEMSCYRKSIMFEQKLQNQFNFHNYSLVNHFHSQILKSILVYWSIFASYFRVNFGPRPIPIF